MTSLLYSEITEQAEVLAHLLDRRTRHRRNISPRRSASAIRATSCWRRAEAPITPHATANICSGRSTRCPAALATPSIFTLYQQPPRLDDALVIAISQSGQSPDIVSVVAEGRRQGALTVALTNAPDSPLAQAAEHTIYLHAGAEKAVAATKTYTTSLMALAMLSFSAGSRMRRASRRWRACRAGSNRC